MYDFFEEEIKKETIVLFNIKNIKESSMSEYKYIESEPKNSHDYYSYFIKQKEQKNNFTKEEILEKMNELRNESLLFYANKNPPEDKQLESAFRQIKLSINFPNKPNVLSEGKFYSISQGNFIAYDSKFFKKLYEMPNMIDNETYFINRMNQTSNYEKLKRVISVIQLENNDLVFAYAIGNKNILRSDYEIAIYRLKDKEYSLFQTIQEGQTGFSTQREYSGCMGYPKHYAALFLKEISGNRFFCISNYGFKIYSLNEKNEYCLISLGEHIDGQQIIQEISENKFIFCNKKSYGMSYGSPSHDAIYIDMIEVNEIKNFDFNMAINNSEKEKSIEQCKIKKLFNYSTYAGRHSLSDCALIKKKFFIVMIDNKILIFDAIFGKLLKKYEILIDVKDNLYINTKMNIKKWNNLDDNEFILLMEGNVILFELREDENENIQLIIKNQSYSQNIKSYDIDNIKKLSEKSNKFYIIDHYNKYISLF